MMSRDWARTARREFIFHNGNGTSSKILALLLCGLAAAGCARFGVSGPPARDGQAARGVVFHDSNGNGVRDSFERGLKGVRVSNGREIARTDEAGRYRLPASEDSIFFVIKPRGWAPRLSEDNLPLFYYVHKPAGSPPLRYPGVAPTGPLPESVDFALHPQDEPDRFDAIIFGDTQPRDQREIDYIAHDVIEELIGAEAMFGVTLGDIMFDDLSLFGSLNRAIALIGVPWHNVIGNHDINFDASHDRYSDETFESVYGPAYYSFDYGKAHFLVLDNVEWLPARGERKGRYQGGLGAAQLEFIRNDLAMIPEKQLLVLFMHVPLTAPWDDEQLQALYRLIEDRPLSLSFSAHTHYQAHRFITGQDGWRGAAPHHHVVNVTVCGSWWKGLPDERGIPHTTMAGGAPNGYSILSFDGDSYSIRFKAASQPEDYQISIFAPEEVEAASADQADVYANVFAGSERSAVEFRVGEDGPWRRMEKVFEPDPYYQGVFAREAERTVSPPYLELPKPRDSYHLWRAKLPKGVAPGQRLIHVRETDMFGQTHTANRTLRVR